MTKTNMIKLIQKREAELFLDLKLNSKWYGENDPKTKSIRSNWYSLNELMGDLGIKTNLYIPETKQALPFILEDIDNSIIGIK